MAKTREQFISEHPEADISFSLINKDVIARRQREGDITLPAKKLDVAKDERWNTKILNSKLIQGLQNGDSIPKIANSILPEVSRTSPIEGMTKRNMQSAIRNARTMVTGAENSGRLDSYRNLAEQGVVQKKVWLATGDDRTRQSHLDIDGEEVEIEEEFSNGLMYPGDPSGSSEEVWQCRCSMRDFIVGFRRADGSISRVEYERDRTRHDDEIDAERDRRVAAATKSISSQSVAKVNTDELDRFVSIDSREHRRLAETMDIDSNETNIIYGGWDGYVQTANSFEINDALRDGAIDRLSSHNQIVVEALQDVINRNTVGEDIKAVRLVGTRYMHNAFGLDSDTINHIFDHFDEVKGVLDEEFKGLVITEKGFMSVSTNVENNVFTNRPVLLDIYVPKDTHALVTTNYGESECIFGHGSEYEVLGFDMINLEGTSKLVVKVIMR